MAFSIKIEEQMEKTKAKAVAYELLQHFGFIKKLSTAQNSFKLQHQMKAVVFYK